MAAPTAHSRGWAKIKYQGQRSHYEGLQAGVDPERLQGRPQLGGLRWRPGGVQVSAG